MTAASVPEKSSPASALLQSAARLLAPLAVLVLMGLIFTWLTGGRYLQPNSLGDIGSQAAIIVIVGIAQTLIIITGGIDLSVGAVVAFTGTLAAILMLKHGWPPAAAVVAGTLAGGAIGFFNGFVSVRTRLHPFIITLGSMMIFRGLAQALTGAQSTNLLPESARFLGGGVLALPLGGGTRLVFGPILLLYIVVSAAVAHVMLTRTQMGRYCFAIGSNSHSARLSGIRVDSWTTFYFVIAGLLFGFGGVVQAARLGIADPNTANGMELDAVAAAVIGGTSLSGGRGTILGTVIGAFLMAGLRQGLRMENLEPYWQTVALGTAIIAAVIYDRASRRQKD